MTNPGVRLLLLMLAFAAPAVRAQGPQQDVTAPLAFREDWKDSNTPSKTLTPGRLTNPNLQIAGYGAGKNDVQIVQGPGDPVSVSFGTCAGGQCAFALRDPGNYLDLRIPAKVRWRTIQDGFHEIRLILKLADGAWLISDHNEGGELDWTDNEFFIQDVRWRRFNINSFTPGVGIATPDLRRVDEIGCACFTPEEKGCSDLLNNLEHSPRLDWIEVYANKLKRVPQ